MNIKEDFAHIDGVRTHYYKVGKGKPIIFVHGWPLTPKPTDFLPKRFGNEFTFYLFDLPGFGKSSKLKEKHSLENYSKFLSSFIKKLRIKKPVIISCSLGGVIALKYSIKHQSDISGLVVCGSLNSVENLDFRRKIFGRFVLWSYDNSKLVKSFIENLTKDEDKVKKIWKMLEPSVDINSRIVKDTVNSIKTTDLNVIRGLLGELLHMDFMEECKRIKIPTLFLTGEKDNFIPQKTVRDAHESIPNSEFIVVLNADHSSIINEQSAKSIHDFIENKCF